MDLMQRVGDAAGDGAGKAKDRMGLMTQGTGFTVPTGANNGSLKRLTGWTALQGGFEMCPQLSACLSVVGPDSAPWSVGCPRGLSSDVQSEGNC